MSENEISQKATKLLREHQQAVYRRTDRLFAVLMVVQWIAGVVAALWISPQAWSGATGSLHPHVVAAILFGGLITSLPVALAITRPGHTLTRHAIAVAQMLVSALLIHLTGGRIETHFHVFGSLAFLACYRDWRVLVTATLVIVADHLVRGLVWPYSVYGVLAAPIWRSLEHGGWVLFEDMFLFVAIRQSVAEMRNVALVNEAMSETAAELRRSKEALSNQTRILESVLTSMGDGVIVADCDGKFLVFNPAAEHILQCASREVSPEAWTETFALFQTDRLTPYPADDLPLMRAIRGEATDDAEIYIRRDESSDGNWISVTGRPLKVRDGEFLGGVIVFRDITEAKKNQEALERAKQIAEAANIAKSEFLANMSHEIRTPLSSILGFTELLRRDIGCEQQKTMYLETISSSGRHLSSLIDDILDLSKVESGRMEFERVRCSPHQILTEVMSVLRVRAQEKSLSLECSWTSGVPETILSDPARLRQLLMNLVGNAIKFTERGGVQLLARLDIDQGEPYLLIEVHDTGIGIPSDRVERIFSPFEQADSSITRRFGGTGLGLAICRLIAFGLGGEVTVESKPGQGSVFRVRVRTGPLDEVPILTEPPTEALSTKPSTTATAETLQGARVLLVEDGESNRQLISLVLEEAGARVTCAENGQEGVLAAGREPFDLILMDMQMPVMDGYTATRRLRELACGLPIVALTAHAMRGDREKALVAGCDGYLTKPIDIDGLMRTVAQYVGQQSPIVAEVSPSEKEEAGAIHSSLPADNPRFRPIIASFVERLAEKLAAMRAAQAQADWRELAQLAHWLHGSGGTVGFACFTEPAGRLEQLAKAGQGEHVAEVIAEISALAGRLAVPAGADNHNRTDGHVIASS